MRVIELDRTSEKAFDLPIEHYDGIEEPTNEHELDSPESKRVLYKLQDWWSGARSAQSANRREMATDADFYDGQQWTAEEIEILLSRHQYPSVFNIVGQSVNWITGTEKKTRIDHKVIPRGSEDVESAANKEQLLKYVSDVNGLAFERSAAFEEAVICGISFLEIGIRGDSDDEPLFVRHETWRNVWHDHLARAYDLDDARFIFRVKLVDLDIAKKMFPERAGKIEASSENTDSILEDSSAGTIDHQNSSAEYGNAVIVSSGTFGGEAGANKRKRVKLIEAWFRMPAQVKVLRGPQNHPLHNVEFDDMNPLHVEAANTVMSVHDNLRMKTYMAVFCGDTLLHLQPSPYHHNRFPFVPIVVNKRSKDNMPYGVVRNMRDPQRDLNKRMSKALHILSSNKVIMEKQAVDDIDELEEQAARPDGIIEKNAGKELQIFNETNIATGHLQLADYDKAFVRDASGVQGESVGDNTNAMSGKAIIAKQNEGAVVTFKLFDNLRRSVQIGGEIMLALIEQFYDMPKVIRLIGERGQFEFQQFNTPEFDAVTGTWVIRNPITASKADFVVDTRDFRANHREMIAEQMSLMFNKLPPEMVMSLMDLWVELFDIPGKDEFVNRIRKINGQVDPDSTNDPEVLQQQQAAAQEADMQKQLAQAEQQAKLAELQAKAAKYQAEALRTRVAAQKQALDAGVLAVMNPPQAADVADVVMAKAR